MKKKYSELEQINRAQDALSSHLKKKILVNEKVKDSYLSY